MKRQPSAVFLKPPWCQFFFVVIHRLPVSRQTRADLIIKATHGWIFKAASESAIERIGLDPTRQIPPGPWPPSVRLCGSNWGWLFPLGFSPRPPWGCTSALDVEGEAEAVRP